MAEEATAPKLSGAALLAEVDRLRAQNEELKRKADEARATRAPASIRFKVSEKGAVSVYGLGRFPVTLYVGQWERLIPEIPALQAFIRDNDADLARKDS